MNPYASPSSLECEVLQADPVGLVQILYRGAIDSIRQARVCMESGDTAGRAKCVSKACEIVAELMLSVDREQGGEIGANLIELYDYVIHLITQAHIQQSARPLTEAAQLMQTLLEGWDSVAAQQKQQSRETAGEELAMVEAGAGAGSHSYQF